MASACVLVAGKVTNDPRINTRDVMNIAYRFKIISPFLLFVAPLFPLSLLLSSPFFVPISFLNSFLLSLLYLYSFFFSLHLLCTAPTLRPIPSTFSSSILHPNAPPLEIGDLSYALREGLIEMELMVLRFVRFRLNFEHPHQARKGHWFESPQCELILIPLLRPLWPLYQIQQRSAKIIWWKKFCGMAKLTLGYLGTNP